MNKKMKKMLMSFITAVVLMLTCSTAAFADDNDPTRFVKGTEVDGILVGGMTVEEAKLQVETTYAANYKLTIKENGTKTEVITGPEIGYVVTLNEGLQVILEAQNAGGRKSGPHAENSHQIPLTAVYNDEAMAARIQALTCVAGTDVVVTTDAHISAYQEGQPFVIVPEVQGNDVDVEAVTSVLRGAVTIGLTEIDLAEWGCYRTVGVTTADAGLQTLCASMNQVDDMTITYTFGAGTEVLTGEVISSWITGSEGGAVTVDQTKAAAYITSLAAKYDTAGTARNFLTTGGTEVPLTGPYGFTMNQEAETAALIAMIQTGQTQTREPQYAKSAADRTGPDWGNTYVEIDLTGQHVYMYKDGVQVWDAPCVTGNVSKNYTTPTGIYSLTYKQTDRILRGAKQADGTYEYESHVNYWMPFNGGIGLHDADWRSKFGGTIYQYGGSHGCINLPPAKAKILYDLVYTGIPVICYN